jgi:preprotein translocase subunit YajC
MIFTLAFADTTQQAVTTATAAAAPVAAQPSTLGMLLPFALMFAVFYFLMIRPQQKKMKDHETLMTSLQKGEEVITQAGIFGKIHGIADKFITIEVDNNVKIKVLKSQIATVLRGEQKA